MHADTIPGPNGRFDAVTYTQEHNTHLCPASVHGGSAAWWQCATLTAYHRWLASYTIRYHMLAMHIEETT